MSTPRRRGRRWAGLAVGVALAAGVAAPTALAASSESVGPNDSWLCIGNRGSGGVCVGDVDDTVLDLVYSLLGLFSGAEMANAFSL